MLNWKEASTPEQRGVLRTKSDDDPSLGRTSVPSKGEAQTRGDGTCRVDLHEDHVDQRAEQKQRPRDRNREPKLVA
jgi:hypothetical protein